MVRPKRYDARTATAIRFRPEVHQQLHDAAAERDLSINWLVNRAVEDYLSRLRPVAEMAQMMTRPPDGD